MNRIEVRGQFFWDGAQKFFLRGVTYGPFAPHPLDGSYFPEVARATQDFQLMQAAGLNTLRVYYPPPSWFLDLAQGQGLRVLVTIPDYKRNLFLDDRKTLREIKANIAKVVTPQASHPALLGYVVDNEMPPDLVRWYGAARIEKFLGWMRAEVKAHDPTALVTYANFPPTEYLQPEALDFFAYNVFLHRPPDLEKYLQRLQNLTGDKPLVLSEFGLDTLRHGEGAQAQLLAEELAVIFRGGAAGAIVFAWSDAWFARGEEVTDWAFGLVTKEREPKPSYQAVRAFYASDQRFNDTPQPKVSVVVCAYNAADTLPACLDALQRLNYPDYEVVLVDDGSTDETSKILASYAGLNVIRQENQGLSVARNVGLAAASGDIVAYTDADCAPDPDWLAYAVRDLVREKWAAVGGPNLPPAATNAVQAAVAVAPGGPSHVLFDDRRAEHIPGCNLVGRREVFVAIGGFDPQFRQAGDDVDFCWRLLEAGYVIGFSPAALVWHDRRRTLGAYWQQQRGYGEAEALLRDKFPHYFGDRGGARWRGAVYGELSTRLKGVIYHGTFGQGFFQSIYRRTVYSWWDEVATVEWLMVTILLAAWLLAIPTIWWLAVLMALAPILRAAWVTLTSDHCLSLAARGLLFLMELTQPWVRGWARYFPRGRGRESNSTPRLSAQKKMLEFWSETGVEREAWLTAFCAQLKAHSYRFATDRGWSTVDVFVYPSIFSVVEIKTMTEIYPQGKRLTRVQLASKPSRTGWLVRSFLGVLNGLVAALLPSHLLFAFMQIQVLLGIGIKLRAVYRPCGVLRTARDSAEVVGLQPIKK